jgi:hypothetical protein
VKNPPKLIQRKERLGQTVFFDGRNGAGLPDLPKNATTRRKLGRL